MLYHRRDITIYQTCWIMRRHQFFPTRVFLHPRDPSRLSTTGTLVIHAHLVQGVVTDTHKVLRTSTGTSTGEVCIRAVPITRPRVLRIVRAMHPIHGRPPNSRLKHRPRPPGEACRASARRMHFNGQVKPAVDARRYAKLAHPYQPTKYFVLVHQTTRGTSREETYGYRTLGNRVSDPSTF